MREIGREREREREREKERENAIENLREDVTGRNNSKEHTQIRNEKKEKQFGNTKLNEKNK